MKKAIYLFFVTFYTLCILAIPYLIIYNFEPSGKALFFAIFLAAVSGLSSFYYYLLLTEKK